MVNYEEKIGSNIRDVRNKAGISQHKLAERCSFSNTMLSNYETGKNKPSLTTLAKIAKQLNVSIDRLYYGDENEIFITSEPDIGRKVVNAMYLLWELGVVSLHDYYSFGAPFSGQNVNRVVLYVNLYAEQIQRLLVSLNEYRIKKSTYNDPEQYLEIILSSVANEINRMSTAKPLGNEDIVRQQ